MSFSVDIKGPGIGLAVAAMFLAYVAGFGPLLDGQQRWALIAAVVIALVLVPVVEIIIHATKR